jgi:hypothetical protein
LVRLSSKKNEKENKLWYVFPPLGCGSAARTVRRIFVVPFLPLHRPHLLPTPPRTNRPLPASTPRTPPQWLRRPPPPPPPPSTAAAAAPIQIEREVTKQTMVPVDLLVDATPTANQHRSAGHRSSWTPPPSPTKLSAACRRHRPATVAAASTAVRCASSSSPLPSPPSHHRHPHRLPQCACASE